jgi:ribonucleoside-triphosphate reductase
MTKEINSNNVKENSNMDYSLQGLNNYLSSNVTKEYWLDAIYTKEIRIAHCDGAIHIHDLGQFAPYCVGWDLQDILLKGFKGVKGKTTSFPPKHFRTALGQITNFLYTLQGEAAGAQALSNFDTLLAPFIKYDNLNYDEVKQAVQEFIFNMNIPTRVGFQTVFSNLTIDLKVPALLKDSPVIINGEYKKETYSNFQEEMDLLNKAFSEIMLNGDSSGRVFTFPIPTYNITKDFDWDNPNIENVWKMTGKYGIPYFANFVNSDLNPDDFRSMCCRLRLSNVEINKRSGGLFNSAPLTGALGVVTINLPRIAFTSNSKESFLSSLDDTIDLAVNSLNIKRKTLEKFTDNNLYPYSKFYLRKIKERTGSYWDNHFSTIGILGANEACLNLFGKDISTPEGKVFILETMNHINDKIKSLRKKYNSLFNLEATPAETTSYRFSKIDKDKFNNKIICANEEDYKKGAKPFYTNSTNLPINYTDDIFEALEHQCNIQTKYTGGTTHHIFLKEKIEDINTVKNLIKSITENFKIPYFTLTPTFSVCDSHGYISGEKANCPKCGGKTEIYSRIVGYLRPLEQWNESKEEEFKLRKTFKIDKSLKKGV